MLKDKRIKVEVRFSSPIFHAVSGRLIKYKMEESKLTYYVGDAVDARQVGRILLALPAESELLGIEVSRYE